MHYICKIIHCGDVFQHPVSSNPSTGASCACCCPPGRTPWSLLAVYSRAVGVPSCLSQQDMQRDDWRCPSCKGRPA